MNTVTLNDALSITYPKGFHVMDEAEEVMVFQQKLPERWAIWDTKRHIIINVQWHRAHGLLLKVADPKDLAKRIGRIARKTYRKLDYRDETLFETEVCGRKAAGIRYAFTIDGVSQVSEAIVFKGASCSYTIYYTAREANDTASHKVFDRILASLSLDES